MGGQEFATKETAVAAGAHIFQSYDESIQSAINIDLVAHTALCLLERWALATAAVDGEDSAGRQKLRAETPEETVDRAFAIAEAWVKRAVGGGHLKDLGPLEKRSFVLPSYDSHIIAPVKHSKSFEEEQQKQHEESRRLLAKTIEETKDK